MTKILIHRQILLSMVSVVSLFILGLYEIILAGTISLPRTGQTRCYVYTDGGYYDVNCSDTGYTVTGQDGKILSGIAWPSPRFTDNEDGTVTDNLTSLIWLKDGNCTDTVGGISKTNGFLTWQDALNWVKQLSGPASGGNSPLRGSTVTCGLSDGSSAGDWRLPNVRELESLINSGYNEDESASNAAWLNISTEVFTNVQAANYWTSSSKSGSPARAWVVSMDDGSVTNDSKGSSYYVLPVRGGNQYSSASSSPGSKDFGSIYTDSESSEQTFTISYTGTNSDPLRMLQTVISGSNANQFTKSQDNCSGQDISDETTCTIKVKFRPTSEGSKTANLIVPPNVSISLSGTGVYNPPPPPDCTYSITPTSQGFGYLGGTGSVSVSRQQSECTDVGWNVVSNDSWITLTSGSSGIGIGTVSYTVKTNELPIQRQGSITIAGNTFTVRQDKNPNRKITIEPSELEFGLCSSGKNMDMRLTITNAGSNPLTFLGFQITGPNSSFFSYSTLCSYLLPGKSCTITVTYHPLIQQASGDLSQIAAGTTHTASLIITSDDPVQPIMIVSLTGSASSSAVNPNISATPSSIDIPYLDIEFGNNKGITISNTGAGTLMIETIYLQGRDNNEFSINGRCGGIEPSKTCNITLLTRYTSMDTKEASIVILSNAVNAPRLEIPIRAASGKKCGLALNRTSITVSSGTYSGTVMAMTDRTDCWWKAYTDERWITLENSNWRNGSSQINYSVSENTSIKPRIGNIYISGKVFTIVQAAIVSTSNLAEIIEPDITTSLSSAPSSYYIEAGDMLLENTMSNFTIFRDTAGIWSENYINAIYAAGYTSGCNQNPLMYCPSGIITNETGAVFLIRALEGNPMADYCKNGNPFIDVDNGRWSCPYIKRSYERRITSGCNPSGSQFCPNQEMTRRDTSIALIRALYGDAFNYRTEPYFTDVLADDIAFKYIQKLKELNITKAAGMFYPDRVVTREEMAVFEARTFLGME